MSLLTMIQDACVIVGIPKPSSVIGNADESIQLMLALANQEGRTLSKRGDWTLLQKEATFTTVYGQEAYDISTIASDFERFLNQTFFDRTEDERVFGPMTPQTWQAKKTLSIATSFSDYRVRGGQLLLYPTPGGANDVYFEYVSNGWCQSSGGTPQSAWAADDDTGVLPEHVMQLGIQWRFLKAKNVNYSEEFREYEREAGQELGRDGSSPQLALNKYRSQEDFFYPCVPNTGYGP